MNSNAYLTGEKLSASRLLKFRVVFILGALAAFGPLSIDMYLPALPSLTAGLHTTASLAQLSITACLLGISLGQLYIGAQSDIRGRRKPLLLGLVAYTVVSLWCAVSSSIFALVVLRFVQGVAGSAGIVISRAVVRDLYSGPEMMKFIANLALVNGLGPILAPIIGAQLLHFTSWRGVFIVLTAVGLFMLGAVLFGLPESLPKEMHTSGGLSKTLSIFKELLTDRDFIKYALPQGFITAAMFAYISGSPFVVQNIYGASPQIFSLIFAMNGLGIIIFGQITGKLAGKVKGVTLFTMGITLAAIAGLFLLIAILLHASLPVILVPLFVVVACVGAVGTAGSALAMENYAHAAGSASALLGLMSFIFGAFVAPLVGLGGSNTAIPMGVIIALTEISALLSFLLLRLPNKAKKRIIA